MVLLLTPPVLTILFRERGSSGSASRLLTALCLQQFCKLCPSLVPESLTRQEQLKWRDELYPSFAVGR